MSAHIALLPFATGLLGAAVLYVIFVRPHAMLATRFGQRAAAVLTVIAAAMLIVLPGTWLVMTVIGEGPAAISALEQGRFVSAVHSLRIGEFDVGPAIATASSEFVAILSRGILQLINGALHATINLVIALFGLYFLLVAPAHSWSRVARHLPFSHEGTADAPPALLQRD